MNGTDDRSPAAAWGEEKGRIALFLLSFLSMVWGFRLLLFEHAPGVFAATEEDLSYGWYVPLFTLYVLWTERGKVRASFGRPCAAGLLLLLPSLFLGYVGARGGQVRFEMLGFVGTLVSLALCVFGRRTAAQTLFPFLFLLFCLPLHSFLDVVTIHLRLFAVGAAYEALRGLGADVVRQGTMLASSSGSFAIDVADPCSGLRSLFAMLALTAGYAYFTQPTWARRALLFSLAVPIAVLGNVVRIFTIVAVAASCSPTFATGFYHDYSGYVVFLVSVFLMVAGGGLLTKASDFLRAQKKKGQGPKE